MVVVVWCGGRVVDVIVGCDSMIFRCDSMLVVVDVVGVVWCGGMVVVWCCRMMVQL